MLTLESRFGKRNILKHNTLSNASQMKKFHYNTGANITLSNLCTTATRTHGTCTEGLTFTSTPVNTDKKVAFKILKTDPQWFSSMKIGFTSNDPDMMKRDRIPFSSFVSGPQNGYWVPKFNIDFCTEGDVVYFYYTKDMEICYGNGVQEFEEVMPGMKCEGNLWGVMDVIGRVRSIKLLDSLPFDHCKVPRSLTSSLHFSASKTRSASQPSLASYAPSSFSFSSSRSADSAAHSRLRRTRAFSEEELTLPITCSQTDQSYKKLCTKFFESLNVDSNLLDEQYTKCYCQTCHDLRGDKLVYKRGNPPKPYILPVGWCRFALKPPPRAHTEGINAFKTWHRAYHGTRKENLSHILAVGELLMTGDIAMGHYVISPPLGHFTEDRKPKGFNINRIFLTPSIRYASREAYAKSSRFLDNDTGKMYEAKIVLQVLIKPNDYTEGPETVGATKKGETLDPRIPNDSIEWMTDRRGAVIIYGILIKLEVF